MIQNDTIATRTTCGRLTSSAYDGVTLPGSATLASDDDHLQRGGGADQGRATTDHDDQRGPLLDLRRGGEAEDLPRRQGHDDYTYNLAGWVTQVADPRPKTTYFGYDSWVEGLPALGGVHGDHELAETWAYDPQEHHPGQEPERHLQHHL